ncbi:hypothetical protein E4U55_005104 [Claviceps digitariae]|nr:hypothetical protein E4U55_005104 [Claviceps digitariae]
MQAVCLGRAHCIRLGRVQGTSTSLGAASKKSSQQNLFSTCPRRLLPERRSRFSPPLVDGPSGVEFDSAAYFISRLTDRSSQQQGPRRDIAASSECTDTQYSSPRDRGKRSSRARQSCSRTEIAPPERPLDNGHSGVEYDFAAYLMNRMSDRSSQQPGQGRDIAASSECTDTQSSSPHASQPQRPGRDIAASSECTDTQYSSPHASQQQGPGRDIAASSECTDTQYSSPHASQQQGQGRDIAASSECTDTQSSSPHASQQQGPGRDIAASSECTDTQYSSPHDSGKCSSTACQSHSSTEIAPPERFPPLNYPKFTRKYTLRRHTHGHDSWIQWGYYRHQYRGEELSNFRRVFNAWKKRLFKIRNDNNEKPGRPWERDAEWLLEHDTVSAMRSAWHELDETTRQEKWPLLMLSAMRLSPLRVHKVLEATMNPRPPGYAIHDVLTFIVGNLDLYFAQSSREQAVEAKELVDFLKNIIIDLQEDRILVTQRVFGLFAKALPTEQAHELYVFLREHEIQLHPNSLIQFASKFAISAPHKEVAFEILQLLWDIGAHFNEARPSSVITSLLHTQQPEGCGVDDQPSFDARKALEYFLERGYEMNVIGSTAFLDTLCQTDEVEEAIRLASVFHETGIQLDKKAWATIFRGAKGSLRVDNIAKAVELAKVANVPTLDVLNNALHSAFVFSEAERREKVLKGTPGPAAFIPMLRAYAKKFPLEPLQWWIPDSLPFLLAADGTDPAAAAAGGGWKQQQFLAPDICATRLWDFESTIIPFVDQLFSAGGDMKLQPSLTTIAIMLRAYIRSLRVPYHIVSCYALFRSRLEEQSRDPTLPSHSRVITNQGSLIHDTFILSMTDYSRLSRAALEVFGDMLKEQMRVANADENDDNNHNDGSSTSSTDSDDLVAASMVHPAPTVMTFTVLLRGLVNSRSHRLGERILEVMREQGIKPNLVTWNTFVSGYAFMQNTRRTVDILLDMQEAGYKPDMYTMRAFVRLRDQARALKLMERLMNERNNRETMARG